MIGAVKEMFRNWWQIALMKKKPEQVFAEAGSLQDSIVDYLKALAVVFGILFIIGLIFTTIFMVYLSVALGSVAGIGSAIGLFTILFLLLILIIIFVIYFVVLIVLAVAINFILNAIFHVSALAFGGKGKFDQTVSALFRLDAALTGSFMFVLIVLYLISTFVMVGILISETSSLVNSPNASAAIGMSTAALGIVLISILFNLLYFAFSIYYLVLIALILRAAHSLSNFRAAMAALAPAIILFVLALLFILSLGVSSQSMAEPVTSFFSLAGFP